MTIRTRSAKPMDRARRSARKPSRTLAADNPSPRRVARMAAPTDEIAALRTRLAEIEARDEALADRLAWTLDQVTSLIEALKTKEAR